MTPIPESFLAPVSLDIEDAAKRAKRASDQEIERWRAAASAFVATGLRQRVPQGTPVQTDPHDRWLVTDRAMLGEARVLFREFLNSSHAPPAVHNDHVRLRMTPDMSAIVVEIEP